MSHRVLLGCGMIAGLAFCTQVYATEGKYDQTSCYAGPIHIIQQGDGITAGSYDSTSMMPGQKDTPFHQLSGHCVGHFTIINGELNENGNCQWWNAAGDKLFGAYTRSGDPVKAEGTAHSVQGTGKFEGITFEGKWMPVGTFPPVPNVGSTCSHEWGTYSVR